MCTIGPRAIAEMIVRYRKAHPKVELEVFEESSIHLMDRLERGDLNLVLFDWPKGELQRTG